LFDHVFCRFDEGMWFNQLCHVGELLKAKEIWHEDVECQPPRALPTVAKEFLTGIRPTSRMPHERLVEKLKKAMTKDYINGEAFSEHLFKSLRQCLKQYERKTTHANFILIRSTNTSITTTTDSVIEYAVGFTRSMHPSLDLFKKHQRNETYKSDSSNESETTFDPSQHLVCLFRRNVLSKEEWEPIDCFSIVKLHTSDRSCGTFRRDDHQRIRRFGDLQDEHEPFGHVVGNTLESILPYHARRGKLDGDEPLLPLALVTAAVKTDRSLKKNKSLESKQQKPFELVRWVSGQLHVPKACDDCYYYSVKDVGHFGDELSVENALSLYLDTLLFGLKVAVQVCNEYVNGNLSPPQPMSGRYLMIGENFLTPTLCASPIKGANLIPGVTGRSINQGELFHGTLRLDETFADHLVLFKSPTVDTTQELGVLVKVSSTAVHSLLVHPHYSSTALSSIRYSDKLDLVREELGTVLYAAVSMESGLVTIMADLPRERYKTLHPNAYNLEVLWGGFSKLVKDVLLPMAEFAGVIHADIRPGYDLTCNIFVDESTGGATLKLIDYESFVLYSQWYAPAANYLRREYKRDAVTFIWWQCVSVAYFWSEKLDVDSRTKDDKFELDLMERMLQYNVVGPEWLMKLREQAKRKVSKEEVESVLVVLADLFKTEAAVAPIGSSSSKE
jgi:hypothetical protein